MAKSWSFQLTWVQPQKDSDYDTLWHHYGIGIWDELRLSQCVALGFRRSCLEVLQIRAGAAVKRLNIIYILVVVLARSYLPTQEVPAIAHNRQQLRAKTSKNHFRTARRQTVKLETQHPETPSVVTGGDLRIRLHQVSSVLRHRP